MMKYYTLILTFFLFYKISIAQNHSYRADGNLIKTTNTYFNPNLKKEAESATDYIGVYQKFISGIRGSSCPMYPSCSNYGLKVFSEKSFAEAMLLTSDRLLRCGHDHKNYHHTLRENGLKLLDYPYYDTIPKSLIYHQNTYKFAYSDLFDDTRHIAFIKSLINNGYYNEALLEIMRIEFENKSFNTELFINKLICLRAINEHEKAIFEFETNCPQEFKLNYELLYQVSLLQYQLGNFSLSQKYIENSLSNCNEEFARPKLICLKGLLQAKQLDFINSQKTYSLLKSHNGFEKRSDYFTSVLKKELKYKNPTFAGVLALIPGAGYAYSGHKQTALSSLIVNGLLAYASYSSFKNNNKGLGILTGVFGVSFYIGNIQGSVNSAKRYNQKQKQNIINKLENNSFF